MKKRILNVLITIVSLTSYPVMADQIKFHPISHASFVIDSPKLSIFVDPVGDIKSYSKFKPANLILITHIHKDHLDKKVVDSVKKDKTLILGPKSVIEKLGYGDVINNGQSRNFKGIKIEAIPAYNITKNRLHFHPKGRDNGYIITFKNKRIYISGDTEDTLEMRSVKNIDEAFVCMNLPFTMTEEQAASAVLDFKPNIVYPYHYRGRPNMSDIDKFERLISKNKSIKVKRLNWYNK
jgi:L-ascorbate metabolism protein UlaG (beta-lactamase superfamily)